MKPSASSDGICQVPTSDLKDKEQIFSIQLIQPLVLTGAFFFVKSMSDELEKSKDEGPELFKKYGGVVSQIFIDNYCTGVLDVDSTVCNKLKYRNYQ